MGDWTTNLTPDQLCVMRCLSGFATDIAELMAVMTRGMDNKMNNLVRLGYVETLIKALDIKEEK